MTLRLVAGVVATILLASCSSAADPVADAEREVADVADATPPGIETYVALGDSFTAGPLVPSTDLADGCFRSDSNYPALVADRLDVDELVDVSCSGARTRDLVRRQPTVEGASVPPQLDALPRRADLVTLGIGGNDFDLFHRLVATCSRVGEADPTGTPCTDELEQSGVDLVAQTRRIGARVEASLRRIQRRAPDATVLLVGYLRLAPASGTCEDLPFAEGDYAYGAQVSGALNDALAGAARRTEVTFVDVHALSEDHDVCSEEPWVNGIRTVEGEALAFHPFAAGMSAVAEEIVATLDG